MNARLSRWTDIVIALSCLTVAGLFVEQRFFASPPPVAEDPAARELIGKKAPEIAGVSYAQAPRTLMIIVRSTCKFCNESMPFWKRLMERRGTGGDSNRLRVVAVSDEPVPISTEYLRRYGLASITWPRRGWGHTPRQCSSWLIRRALSRRRGLGRHSARRRKTPSSRPLSRSA